MRVAIASIEQNVGLRNESSVIYDFASAEVVGWCTVDRCCLQQHSYTIIVLSSQTVTTAVEVTSRN